MCLLSITSFAVLLISTFSRSVNSEVTPILKTVDVGGCVDEIQNTVIFCAAFETDCEAYDNLRFKTSHELADADLGECTTEDIPLGTCNSTGKCAITKDSCSDPNDYVSADINYGACNAEGNSFNYEFIPTQYGGCKDGETNEIICALTPTDCTDREAWLPASAVEKELEGGCRCHDVKVGLCKGNFHDSNIYKCAIASDNCDRLVQNFSTAREVIDQPLRDCRLCPYHETLVGSHSNSKNINAKKIEKGKGLLISNGALAGIVIGSVVALFATVALIYYKKKTVTNTIDTSKKTPKDVSSSIC